jgi:truncated hemoglobin YjbI
MPAKLACRTPIEFDRMAGELERVAEIVRKHPEIHHHLAERLQLLARDIREEAIATPRQV